VANHPSALKRDRQRRKKQTRNRSMRAIVRSVVKDARAALGTDKGPEAVREATSALSHAGQKGAMNKRTASRRISRLAKAQHKAVIAAAHAAAQPPVAAKAPKSKGGRATKAAAKPAAAKPAAAKPAAAKAPAKPRAKKEA
jgi:small subunit ribosomal protein S20